MDPLENQIIPLQCLYVPLKDMPFSDLLSHLPQTTAFIANALLDPRSRVLVHCVQGVSRSASVVAAYLIATEGTGALQAIARIKSRRPSAEPNWGFVQQLTTYANSLLSGRR